MNKKYLEAIKTIGDLDYIDEYDYRDGSLKQHFNEEFTIVEKALQRLEAIDNANPSEALECLEWVIKNYIGNDYYVYEEELITIKQALLKAQEQEKVLADVEKVKSGKTIIHIGKDLVMMNKAKYYVYLENENEPVSKRILQAKCEEQEKVLKIIFKKEVNIQVFNQCEDVETYNNVYKKQKDRQLTQEEFDLLKRWVE